MYGDAREGRATYCAAAEARRGGGHYRLPVNHVRRWRCARGVHRATCRSHPRRAGEAWGGDSDRRLALLRRQRSTLHDLLERRRTLLDQLESASLTLQNLKLDLLKLRSAGMGSALEDVTSATREARALSRDIGHLLDAADDVRKL